MSRSLVFLVLVVGCGDDGGAAAPDASNTDAPSVTYDFSCAGIVAPTTAPDPTSIRGSLVDLTQSQTLPNVTVDVHRASDDTVLASTTTGSNGTYQTSIATAGAAIEIYRRATAVGYAPTRVYGARIVSGTNTLDNIVLTTSERDEGGTPFGVTLDPLTGSIITVVRDCSNVPVAGAQIAVSPSPTRIGYYDDEVAAPASTQTGSDGYAIAWGVPPGPATVTITYGTTSWRVRPVSVEANGVVLSFRQP